MQTFIILAEERKTWLPFDRGHIHVRTSEIVFMYVLFCELYAKQPSLIAEIYRHAIERKQDNYIPSPPPLMLRVVALS